MTTSATALTSADPALQTVGVAVIGAGELVKTRTSGMRTATAKLIEGPTYA